MTGVSLGDQLLQVGCTDASLLAAIGSKVGLSGRVCAIVPDEAQAARARRAAEQSGFLLEIETGSLGNFPFEDGAFNLIVVDNQEGLLSSMRPEQRVATLQQAFRTLAPRGRVVVIERGARGGLGALLGSSERAGRSALQVVGRRHRRARGRGFPRGAAARRARRAVLLRRRPLAGTLRRQPLILQVIRATRTARDLPFIWQATTLNGNHTEKLTGGRVFGRGDRAGRGRLGRPRERAGRGGRGPGAGRRPGLLRARGGDPRRSSASRRWRTQRRSVVRQTRIRPCVSENADCRRKRGSRRHCGYAHPDQHHRAAAGCRDPHARRACHDEARVHRNARTWRRGRRGRPAPEGSASTRAAQGQVLARQPRARSESTQAGRGGAQAGAATSATSGGAGTAAARRCAGRNRGRERSRQARASSTSRRRKKAKAADQGPAAAWARVPAPASGRAMGQASAMVRAAGWAAVPIVLAAVSCRRGCCGK